MTLIAYGGTGIPVIDGSFLETRKDCIKAVHIPIFHPELGLVQLILFPTAEFVIREEDGRVAQVYAPRTEEEEEDVPEWLR